MSKFSKSKYIKKLRNESELSQSGLAADICDYTELSKIENEKIDVGWNKFQLISERIKHMDETVYFPYINPKKIEAFEHRNNLINSLKRNELENSKKELNALEPLLFPDSALNYQLICSAKAQISEMEGTASSLLLEKYYEALIITRPDFDELKIKKYMLQYEECILINKLAVHLASTGETARALNIMVQLSECIETMPVDSLYAYETLLPALYHLAQILTNLGEYESVLNIYDKFDKISKSSNRVRLLPRMIYLKAYCLHMTGKSELCEELLLIAYWVHKSFDEHELSVEVKNNAEKIFNIEIKEKSSWTTILEQ